MSEALDIYNNLKNIERDYVLNTGPNQLTKAISEEDFDRADQAERAPFRATPGQFFRDLKSDRERIREDPVKNMLWYTTPLPGAAAIAKRAHENFEGMPILDYKINNEIFKKGERVIEKAVPGAGKALMVAGRYVGNPVMEKAQDAFINFW